MKTKDLPVFCKGELERLLIKFIVCKLTKESCKKLKLHSIECVHVASTLNKKYIYVASTSNKKYIYLRE